MKHRLPGLEPELAWARIPGAAPAIGGRLGITGLVVLLALSAPLAVRADTDSKATPLPRPRLTEELRQQAMAVSPSSHRTKTPETWSQDAATDTPVRGVESNHGIVRGAELPAPPNRPFSLRDGGTFATWEGATVSTEALVQYDAPTGGWDFLKISW